MPIRISLFLWWVEYHVVMLAHYIHSTRRRTEISCSFVQKTRQRVSRKHDSIKKPDVVLVLLAFLAKLPKHGQPGKQRSRYGSPASTGQRKAPTVFGLPNSLHLPSQAQVFPLTATFFSSSLCRSFLQACSLLTSSPTMILKRR